MKFNLPKALIAPLVMLSLALLYAPFKFDLHSLHQASIPATQQVVVTAEAASKPVEQPPKPTVPTLKTVNEYLDRLAADGCSPENQAILIETLDGQILAEHNADAPVNPASVMKLTTSYLSLKHFGPEHQFKTVAYTTGKIDEGHQALVGDLIIETEGDPNFTFEDGAALAASVRSQGIRRVEGQLIVRGPFRFRHIWNPDTSIAKLRSMLGLAFPKRTATAETPSEEAQPATSERVLLAVHNSASLKELLLYMNAHSDNFYAEELGDALGGPEAVRTEVLKEFNISPDSLVITHTSGLDYNRITPRVSLMSLQKMHKLLLTYQMKLEDIMPVAGVDSGTLSRRFCQPGLAGTVVAKTGTLNTTDNGVSALEGVMYSETYGPVLFAIFNMGGGVHYFRQHQDRFLTEAIAELGSPLKTVRSENIFGEPLSQQEEAAVEAPSRFHTRRVALKRSHSFHHHRT